MNGLQRLLSKNRVDIIAVIRRDKGYVALLILLISVFTFAWIANDKPHTTTDTEISSVSRSIPEDSLEGKIQQGEIGFAFNAMMFFIISGTIWGMWMIFMSGYRILRRKSRSSMFAVYLQQDEEKIKTVFSPWSLWDVTKILIVFFTAYLIFILIQEQLILYKGVPKDQVPFHFLMVIDMLFAEIVAVFFMFRIIKYDYGVSVKAFGLKLSRLPHHIATGIKGYFMFLPIYIVIVLLVSNISRELGIEVKAQEVLTMLADRAKFTSFQFSVMILFVGVIGPVFEEIFFRGFLYRALKKSVGSVCGLIVSSALFALIHNNLMAFFPIFGLGIMLGVLLDKTSSLIPSIVMHIMVNSVSMFIVFSLVK